MDPQATERTSPATGGSSGRLASLGADGGDSEEAGSVADMEQESLEEKLRGLAFRKQTSYR